MTDPFAIYEGLCHDPNEARMLHIEEPGDLRDLGLGIGNGRAADGYENIVQMFECRCNAQLRGIGDTSDDSIGSKDGRHMWSESHHSGSPGRRCRSASLMAPVALDLVTTGPTSPT